MSLRRVAYWGTIVLVSVAVCSCYMRGVQSSGVSDAVKSSAQWQVFEACRNAERHELAELYSTRFVQIYIADLLYAFNQRELYDLREFQVNELGLCKMISEISLGRVGRRGGQPYLYVDGVVRGTSQALKLRLLFFEHPTRGLLLDAFEVELGREDL